MYMNSPGFIYDLLLTKSNEIQEHPKRTNMTAILTFIIRIIPQGLTQHK